MSEKKPTIDDVATLSGVGRTTVSRVLNGGPNVRDEVRERVQRAVAMLNYKVNVQARFLAGGASRQLTLVHASDLDVEPNSYYQSGLELGALRACSERGFMLNTLTVNPADPGYCQRILESIASLRSEGIILTPPFSDDLALVQTLIEHKCPVVCVSGGDAVAQIAGAVGIDDEAGGHAMARHLISLGHRSFGFIDGLEEHLSAARRLDGFRRALNEAGIGAEGGAGQLQIARGNFTFRSGIEIAETMLASAHRPTALVCANDDMAAGAMLTAHRMGLEIPADLSVSGFDDTPVSEIIWPPLTTVHQPIRRIGHGAVQLVTQAIQAGRTSTEAGFQSVPYRMVPRASTGRPALEAIPSPE